MIEGFKGLISDYRELLSLSNDQLEQGKSDSSLAEIVNKKEKVIDRIKEKDYLLKEADTGGSEVAPLLDEIKKIISEIVSLSAQYIEGLDAQKLAISAGIGDLVGGKKISSGYAVNRSDKKGIVSIRE